MHAAQLQLVLEDRRHHGLNVHESASENLIIKNNPK
jgi:hypothetical protein